METTNINKNENNVNFMNKINQELSQNPKLDIFLKKILKEIKKTNKKNIICKNKIGIGGPLVTDYLNEVLGDNINAYKSFAPIHSNQALLRQAFNTVQRNNVFSSNNFNIIKEFDYVEIQKFLKTLIPKEKENLMLLIIESGNKEELDKRFKQTNGFKLIDYLQLKQETIYVYIKTFDNIDNTDNTDDLVDEDELKFGFGFD